MAQSVLLSLRGWKYICKRRETILHLRLPPRLNAIYFFLFLFLLPIYIRLLLACSYASGMVLFHTQHSMIFSLLRTTIQTRSKMTLLYCSILLQNGAWNGLMAALLGKKFDMVLTSLKINAERESVVDFTAPFLVCAEILQYCSTDMPDMFNCVCRSPGRLSLLQNELG